MYPYYLVNQSDEVYHSMKVKPNYQNVSELLSKPGNGSVSLLSSKPNWPSVSLKMG